MTSPRRLADCHNIADLRALAKRKLPATIFPHLVGAAEDEETARRNIEAFDGYRILPKCLVDVASVSTATRVLGRDISWPVYCSPTGASRGFHPEGELAVARAAARSGTLYGLSTMANHSLEDVAAATPGPKIYQMFIFRNREITHALIDRAKRAGYKALCLTVDSPLRGNCEQEARSGMLHRYSPRGLLSFITHPGWLLGQLRKGPLFVPAMADVTGIRDFFSNSATLGEQLDPAVSWKDVREFVELWGGPFAIKGILRADDATRAIDVGATAVIVSNHGGRQLDGAAASVEALPQIAKSAGGKVEIILDGGIRRGVHVLKALALGATACSIGRAYLFGLAAGGEAGVRKALDILRSEFVRAMQLAGCTDARNIDPDIIRQIPLGTR